MKRILPLLALVASVLIAQADPLPEYAQIRSVAKDLLLRPVNASNKTGAPIILYPAQSWKCMTWKIEGTDTVTLQNVFTSKPFVPVGEKYQILQADKDAKKEWKVEALPDGAYKIVDPKSGLVLTAIDEDHVALGAWLDKPEQKWKIEAKNPADLTM
jgi:hypothetical protein